MQPILLNVLKQLIEAGKLTKDKIEANFDLPLGSLETVYVDDCDTDRYTGPILVHDE